MAMADRVTENTSKASDIRTKIKSMDDNRLLGAIGASLGGLAAGGGIGAGAAATTFTQNTDNYYNGQKQDLARYEDMITKDQQIAEEHAFQIGMEQNRQLAESARDFQKLNPGMTPQAVLENVTGNQDLPALRQITAQTDLIKKKKDADNALKQGLIDKDQYNQIQEEIKFKKSGKELTNRNIVADVSSNLANKALIYATAPNDAVAASRSKAYQTKFNAQRDLETKNVGPELINAGLSMENQRIKGLRERSKNVSGTGKSLYGPTYGRK